MKVEITEEKIFQAIDLYKTLTGETPVNYMEALSIGNAYKKEGLTPLYIFDEDASELIVTSEENFLGMFN